jgi:DNA-binding beta-propeller fold protein YncE
MRLAFGNAISETDPFDSLRQIAGGGCLARSEPCFTASSEILMNKFSESSRAQRLIMSVQIQWLRLSILAALFSGALVFPCRAQEQIPKLNYEPVPDFFQLPPGEHFVEVAGVAVNSKGHIYVFHRGKHPLMEFDASGKYLRSIADDLFVTAHTVRVDGEDNIWTTDVGSHVVLKLSPDGRVLLSLGRMRMAGDDVLHFNQPTDVAFDREGNIFVTDGEGNSRVLKFNKFGNPVLGWGMKGSGPGQFDLPHSIAVDDDLVYVGDRENARIQIFDLNGRYIREWKVGHPFGLFITPDHFIYMSDAIAGQILKINRDGKVVGVLEGPAPDKARHFDPHSLAVDKDNSIFTAEVLPWRAQKFRRK